MNHVYLGALMRSALCFFVTDGELGLMIDSKAMKMYHLVQMLELCGVSPVSRNLAKLESLLVWLYHACVFFSAFMDENTEKAQQQRERDPLSGDK